MVYMNINKPLTQEVAMTLDTSIGPITVYNCFIELDTMTLFTYEQGWRCLRVLFGLYCAPALCLFFGLEV